MGYNWLAHHLVRRRFPDLDDRMRKEIVSEAICRAWCTFLTPDYRVMQACVTAAAKRRGLYPPTPPSSAQTLQGLQQDSTNAAPDASHRPVVVRLTDYR